MRRASAPREAPAVAGCRNVHLCSDGNNCDDVYSCPSAIVATIQSAPRTSIGANTTETHIYIFRDRLGASGYRLINKGLYHK
jgi:hypothetical protein